MARIVMGNRDGALALAQARTVLATLSDEWPDVHLVQRTIPQPPSLDAATDPMFQALEAGRIHIALQGLDALPAKLPEGLVLAAVTRRLDARSALVSKGSKTLAALPDGAAVGVRSERDRDFLRAVAGGLEPRLVDGRLDDELGRMTAGELEALLLPSATLLALDRRQRITAYLDPEEFAPAPGQGALGLIVRADDDHAFELAYTLQHRPSFDRARAERAFQASIGDAQPVGAVASVSDDGDLTLFGAVVKDGATVQASVAGEAGEAEELGRELAQDVLSQLELV